MKRRLIINIHDILFQYYKKYQYFFMMLLFMKIIEFVIQLKSWAFHL